MTCSPRGAHCASPQTGFRSCSLGVRLGGQREAERSLPPPSLGFPVRSGGTRPAPTRLQGPESYQDGLVLLRDPALLLTAEQVAHGGRPGPCPAALPRSDPDPVPHGHRSLGPTHPATAAARGLAPQNAERGRLLTEAPPREGAGPAVGGAQGP